MWMQDGCKVYLDSYMGIKWIMFRCHFHYFQKPPLGGRLYTKPGEHGTLNALNRWFNYFILSCVKTCMNRHTLKKHLVEGLVTYDFTLHLRVRDRTTWFWRCVGMALGRFLLGLSLFHGHASWLVCEMAFTFISVWNWCFREEVYERWNELLASPEATLFFHIALNLGKVLFTSDSKMYILRRS